LVAARCCTGTKERSFGMSKRKRARALHRWEPAHSEKLRKFDVPVGNLRPEILVVQSAQNWHRQRATDSLDGTRDRRVLMQR
jgi:hypothetical protein